MSTSGKCYIQSSGLEMQNNSFSRLGVRLWNKIPNYITNLPKKAFERVLRKLLFDISEMDDDFIEIPLIIKKVGTYTLVKGFNICLLVVKHCTSVSAVFI